MLNALEPVIEQSHAANFTASGHVEGWIQTSDDDLILGILN